MQNNFQRAFRMLPTVIILWLALCCVAETKSQEKVGIITGITGTAQLKETNAGTEIRLNARNYAVVLRSGQSLKANGKGRLEIRLCNGQTETVRNRWYVVPRILCSDSTESGKRKVLETIFSYGGRHKTNRGDDEFILFPTESAEMFDVIRPETAVFRWMPTKEKITLSINLDGESIPLWSREEVPGTMRSFSSAELTKSLKNLRRRHPDAKLQVKIIIASLGTQNTADFRLFSAKEEEDLQRELTALDREKGIFRHIGRAEVYFRFRLYNETADEYERALRFSPQSPDLLNAAASAQERVGNFERRDSLDNQIRILSKTK